MFSDKISKAHADLKKANRQLQKENEKVFKDLNSIRVFRNQMIHCEFNWSEKALDSFAVWDIIEHETDGQHYGLVGFSVKDVLDKIDEFKSLCISVLKIADVLKADFNKKYPALASRLNFPK